MIEGIHCDVKHDEMVKLLDARIAHHAEKRDFYSKRVAEFEKEQERENGNSSVDVVRSSKQRLEEHDKSVQFLTFVRDHIVPGETYRLSEHDMQRLGFIRPAY